VEVELKDRNEETGLLPTLPAEPLPPVIIKVFDQDKNAAVEQAERMLEKGGAFTKAFSSMLAVVSESAASLTSMGTVVIKNPRILDTYRKKGARLDLNKTHDPVWYALDGSARTKFNSRVGGVEPSWARRPRLLVACGYSQTEETTWGVKTEKVVDPRFGRNICCIGRYTRW